MMNELAANLLRYLGQNTIEASLLIGLILVTRVLLRERLSVRWQYALWFLVCIKILIPWTPSSAISLGHLIPNTLTPPSVTLSALSLPGDPEATAHTTTTVPWSLWSAIGVWIGGMAGIGLYLVRDYRRLTHLVNQCPTLTARPALDLMEQCCSQLHIKASVRLIITDAVQSPALLGIWKPKLLLPASMAHTFTKRQLRHVFYHELAHLKRRDIAASYVASLCHLIHWFNPLVWYAFQQMRTDRELACDQVALTQLSRSEASTLYGQTIIRILEFNRCHPLRAAIAGMGQTRHQVRKRIVNIAEFKPTYEGVQWGAACLLACLAVTGLTRTPVTAPLRPHAVSENTLAQETSPKAPVLASVPTPPTAIAQDSVTSHGPVPAQEESPEQHPFMLSQEYTVSPPQLQHRDPSNNMTVANAQWYQYHYQVQAQLNARQLQMAQNSFIRQQRRTASAAATRRRKRPTQNGIPGIVEMAARQNALNSRTQ
ncbi:MAG: hypothetical protein HQ515_06460 [Phycisphaeraceae bacterium]|nr:hypothetical protein [Phycisphaeraceae bacterium]